MPEQPLRLRLLIRRNGLPDTRLVFSVAVADDTTIAKLLEQVNETVPLESAHWGLDDYAVELQAWDGPAYECLHYQPIAGLLEKDDQVRIRPLSSDDLKKRRIGGRHQISSDGKHLIDGVPFGRPLLKRPIRRPPVVIAPRKRPRLDAVGALALGDDNNGEGDDDGNNNDTGHSFQIVPYSHGSQKLLDDEDDDEDDEDFHSAGTDGSSEDEYDEDADDDDDEDEDGDDDDNEMDTSPDVNAHELQLLQEDAQNPRRRNVHFTVARRDASEDDESSDEGDYSHSDSGSDDDDDDDGDDDGDDDNSNSAPSSDEEGWESYSSEDAEKPASAAKAKAKKPKKSGAKAAQGKTKLAHNNAKPRATSAAPSTSGSVPPGAGRTRTQRRNARRRAKQAMDRAKARQGQVSTDTATPEKSQPAEGSSTNSSTLQAASAASAASAAPESPPAASTPPANAPAPSPSTVERRLKLDVDAGRRMLLSALGLRGPARMQKAGKGGQRAAPIKNGAPDKPPATVAVPSAAPPEAEPEAEPEARPESKAPPPEGHPDHWKSRIRYTAVECCDENFVLDAPTFPFVQQWHRKSQAKAHGNASAVAGTKRKQDRTMLSALPQPKKRAPPEEDTMSDSDSTSSSGSSDSSDSSDDSSDDSADGGPNDASVAAPENASEDEDLPVLPADVSSLPALQPGTAAAGMLITWKTWALSEKTNWQPQVLDMTGKVVGVEDAGATLCVVLARRDRNVDRPEKQYDEETGERVYGRFDVPDLEGDEAADADQAAGDEGDDGTRRLALSEMIEPRVLQGVASGPAGGDDTQ